MPTACAVTGNLEDLSSATNQGYVLFDLINFGDAVPRVIGTANIVNRKLLVQANTSGAISTSLWGNDNIDPAGTLYLTTVLDNTKLPIASYIFDITGTNFDINSATPSPTPPIPVTQPNVIESVTSTAAGNFTVSHSLGKLPTFTIITMKSGGFIWHQIPKFSSSSLFLVASDTGVQADIYVW